MKVYFDMKRLVKTSTRISHKIQCSIVTHYFSITRKQHKIFYIKIQTVRYTTKLVTY